MVEPVSITVVEPGILTTVQDLGRFGQARFGVAPNGALDQRAFRFGNRLLGNSTGDAALEITLVGPRLTFSGRTAVVLTGADLGARLNGSHAPVWEPFSISPGDELWFDPARAGSGARAYLCVTGGIKLDPVMGSRSTDLIGAFGGFAGRALRAGDEITLGAPALPVESIIRRRLAALPPSPEHEISARVVAGPQNARFTPAGRSLFFESPFSVSGKSNRQGIRLSGPIIEHECGADLISEGIAIGAIQVPGDGQPIVLLAGRQTVGGYVKIATVIGADLDRFAQLRPGSVVTFEEVSVEEAIVAGADYRSGIDSVEIVEISRSIPGATPVADHRPDVESELLQMGDTWNPDGVIRVIEAWERTGASHFVLEVASSGLKVELHREPASKPQHLQAIHPEKPPLAETAATFDVKAPVLGIFYRRSSPDLPNLVETGGSVTAGQTICLLEVMKTYHEVTAPQAGILESFAVEDGDFVEYGQVVARIRPE